MIDQHVVSLELSKRLKELGVPQKSVFVYASNGLREVIYHRLPHYRKNEFTCSAFLASELGEMLPKGSYSLLTEYKGQWSWQCKSPKGSFVNGFQSDMNEADARATLLIHLLENSLIPLTDL